MIITTKERAEMTDEKYGEILTQHDSNVKKHIGKVIVYDFFAFVLASSFNHNCILETNTLEEEYIDACDFLGRINFPGYKKLDLNKLNKILEEKYSLKVISEDPIKIEKIQS